MNYLYLIDVYIFKIDYSVVLCVKIHMYHICSYFKCLLHI